jgi:sugar phosphate isomerase/epimerase
MLTTESNADMKEKGKQEFTEVGNGIIDFKKIFKKRSNLIGLWCSIRKK